MNYETAEAEGSEHRLSNYMKIAGFRYTVARIVQLHWSLHSLVLAGTTENNQ